jgi:hypothetical protein
MRLLKGAPARRLLEATVRLHMGRRRRIERSAIDSHHDGTAWSKNLYLFAERDFK